MKPESLAILKKHLEPYIGDGFTCPICKGTQWQLGGPIVETSYREYEADYTSGGIHETGQKDLFILAAMICSKCHFVYHFSWEPILKEAAKSTVQAR